MLTGVDVPCPSCDEPLELVDGDEMGSAPRRYRCVPCCLDYERDASGLVVESYGWRDPS
jgi:hypothetical protein